MSRLGYRQGMTENPYDDPQTRRYVGPDAPVTKGTQFPDPNADPHHTPPPRVAPGEEPPTPDPDVPGSEPVPGSDPDEPDLDPDAPRTEPVTPDLDPDAPEIDPAAPEPEPEPVGHQESRPLRDPLLEGRYDEALQRENAETSLDQPSESLT